MACGDEKLRMPFYTYIEKALVLASDLIRPITRRVGVVVEGVCLLVVLIGRLGRRGAGLVGMLNEVPAALEHEFGPPAVQCKSQTLPDLLEEDGLANPV